MKAIILAAGLGSRLGKYTAVRPKCLLEIGGITVLERQIKLFRSFSIDDIIIVKGFAAEMIRVPGVQSYVNPDYARTNMVYSLFMAEQEIESDVIICYGDVLFDSRTLTSLLTSKPYDISVVVDLLWQEYFDERFERPFDEAESLVYNEEGRILDIGEGHPDPKNVHAQYIGLIKLSERGSKIFRELYSLAKRRYWNQVWMRGRKFQDIYMTDFLQAIIGAGYSVHAIPVKHGWLEFDSVTDYEKVLSWYEGRVLDRFCIVD
ncbi:MAG: phosphocholine cytidylyltransferase family protein [Thaumarchaeota archaeon]|nr:phosphocholine cytidylyltransferase family protein [Nitrososphaerota archaeon]